MSTRSSVNLAEIAKRVPIDRTAASVTSRSLANTFHPHLSEGEVFSPTPLPVRVKPTFSNRLHDLTGKKFGRFTVIGLSVEGKGASGYGRWVVRCVCGWYSVRKSRSLKSVSASEQMCHRCHAIERMRDGSASRPREARL
jgi:hypothetical protein